MLRAALVTLGDPGRLTGGYLFHRRLAELAPRENARLDFVSFPDRPFPLAALDAPRVLRKIDRLQPDAVVLDSIAAAFLGPHFALRRPRGVWLGMLHQPPGGIDYGPPRRPIQAVLDRLAYRRMRRLMVASDSLADELRAAGESRERVHVVPPGRDVATDVVAPPGNLRAGRGVAL